jgi:hypothetical protein
MKSLFWQVVNPQNLKGSIWEAVKDEEVKFDVDDLIKNFGQRRAPAAAPGAASNSGVKAEEPVVQ